MVTPLVHLLVGREEFLKKEFVQSLRSSLFPQNSGINLDYQEFNANNEAANQALDFVRTSPFSADKKMAVVWEIEAFSDEDQSAVLKYAESPYKSGILVLIASENSAKKNDFLRQLSQKAQLTSCHTPFDADWPKWIMNRAKKINVTVTGDAARAIVDRVGKDTASVSNALETLALYVYPRTDIQGTDAEAFLGRSAEADVFQLADSILESNSKSAFKILRSLINAGSRAYEIVPVLASSLERFKKAQGLIRRGVDGQALASELKIHPYFLPKFLNTVRATPERVTNRFMDRLLNCEEAIKTGLLNDTLALEMAIAELCLPARAS